MQIFILFFNYLKKEMICFSKNIVQFSMKALESSILQFIFLNTFDKLYLYVLKYIFNYLIG